VTTRKTVIYVLLALLVLVPVLMVTPAIMQAHRFHQSVACRERLEVLYAAMRAYRQVHGRYPDKLSDLYPTFVHSLEFFQCPAQSRRIHSAQEIDTLSGYVLYPPDLGEWGRKYHFKPLLCDRRGNHPFMWKGCWYDAVLYDVPDTEGIPTIFWMFDIRSVFPKDYPSEHAVTNRYDFPE